MLKNGLWLGALEQWYTISTLSCSRFCSRLYVAVDQSIMKALEFILCSIADLPAQEEGAQRVFFLKKITKFCRI
eukprot:SAG31_NODE_13153_length_889_cov_1.658228_1_plen_74_part_00